MCAGYAKILIYAPVIYDDDIRIEVIKMESQIIKIDALRFHEIQKIDVLTILIKIVGYSQVVEMERRKFEKLV